MPFNRHSWLEDCITRGVPCGVDNCGCAPEALVHYGVKDGFINPHEYLPSELPPEFESQAEVSMPLPESTSAVVDRGIDWWCGRLLPGAPLGTVDGQVITGQIELTDEERKRALSLLAK